MEVDGDLVRIKVAEAPVDGRATEAARRALAAALGVPPASVALTTGRRSRTKHFRVGGLGCSQVRLRLGGRSGGDNQGGAGTVVVRGIPD